jgi:hypothetical protein
MIQTGRFATGRRAIAAPSSVPPNLVSDTKFATNFVSDTKFGSGVGFSTEILRA